MTPSLKGCLLKLNRADHYLDELRYRIAALPDPYSVRGEVDDERGEIVVYLTHVQEPPPDLGIIVGDIAHNLRSLLDHLICQLLLLDGGASCDTSQFPVFLSKEVYDKKGAWRLRGLSPAHRTTIEELQPYTGGNRADPLWLLSEISNGDKHRIVHVATMVMAGSLFEVSGTSGIAVTKDTVRRDVLVEEGAEVARFQFALTADHAKLKVQPYFANKILFGEEIPDLQGRPIHNTLVEIRNYINTVILPKFEAEFA